MMKRLHIHVTGLVQGVFFRAKTRDKAIALGLCGRVGNLADGRVEIVAEGEPEPLEQLVAWCHKGPMLARVTAVDVEEAAATGEYHDFSINR